MPLRGAGRNAPRPMNWRPLGVTDSTDGSNAAPGSMQSLANLIPDPATDRQWVPRPAGAQLTNFVITITGNTHSNTVLDNIAPNTNQLFQGLSIAGPGIPNNTTISSVDNANQIHLSNAATSSLVGATFTVTGFGFISAALVIGDIMYGMIASPLNAGHDQPFAFNLASNSFLTINGILNANTPTSPATTGAWVPPQMVQVGTRIIVTHQGFPGGAFKFGWLDIGALNTGVTANSHNGSAILDGNPNITALQPGHLLSGGGIPVGNTVVSTAPFTLTESGTTHSNNTLDGLASTTGLAVGQTIVGTVAQGIPAGTTISTIGAGSVTMSNAATGSATGSVTFTGATITMSANATADHSQETVTVTGGTSTTPLWGAGDTDRNNLASVPMDVGQFNGRAYFAVGVNGIQYSDPLLPCRISNTLGVQALTTNDGLACTGIGPLMLSAPLTGGIVQSLIVFEGNTKMQQIEGDPVTNNLTMNALPVATGTLAINTIVSCELGLAFVSPEGLRIINTSGGVSPPIGDHGSGVTVPFIDSVQPSRMVAAANADTIRVTTQNGALPNTPNQEWWYDITRKSWSGPHSFPFSQLQPWRATFAGAPIAVTAAIFQSDALPSLSSTYVENGSTLQWTYWTTLMPDAEGMNMNAIMQATLMIALANSLVIIVTAYDEAANILNQITLAGPNQSPTLWGSFVWGGAPWGGTSVPIRQRSLNWSDQVIARQLSVQITGASLIGTVIGNLRLEYQTLGYSEPPGV